MSKAAQHAHEAKLPQPAHRNQMEPDFIARIETLARCKAAKTLLSREATGDTLQTAVESYLAAARKSKLPAEHWRLERNPQTWHATLATPLNYFLRLGVCNAARARAAQTLLDAGCSIWHSEWAVKEQHASIYDHSFFEPSAICHFILAGSDAPLRRVVLKAALNDPKTPRNFISTLRSAYESAIEGSSATAKGVLGPRDKSAKAVCSLLSACSTELIAAAAARRGWEDAKAIAEDASARLAVKKEATQTQSPEAIKKSATKAQKQRLEALGNLVGSHPHDSDFILAGLEVSPWLKQTPGLACVKFSNRSPLLIQALDYGCVSAMDWLEKAGANLWLACAQMGSSNACSYAVDRLTEFSSEADLSPIARMLLRGAWLDGAPDPKERCLALTKAAVEEFCSDWPEDDEEGDKARSLVAHMERLTIEEVIGENPASAPAPKTRRSAL